MQVPKKLLELLNRWLDSPDDYVARNNFFSYFWTGDKNWSGYGSMFLLWASWFLGGGSTNFCEAGDINTSFFEKKLLKFKPSKYKEILESSSSDGWFWRVHRRWCITYTGRYRGNAYGGENPPDIPDPRKIVEKLLEDELINKIRTILKDYPLYFEVFHLSYLGFKMKEIAEQIDKTENAVKLIHYRAKKKLKDPNSGLIPNELVTKARTILESYPLYFEVWYLFKLGLKTEEITEKIGKNECEVKRILETAKKKLKEAGFPGE